LKGLENRANMAKGEQGFLTVIVKPLWETVNRFCGGGFRGQVENIERNLKEW
jgi:hypothetical protein